MKGLLLKDFYMTAKLCKPFVFLDVVFLAVYLSGYGNQFFVYYPCVLTGLIPMSLISYDERERWDLYAGTMPYTRAQMVSAKYLVGLLGSILIFAVTAVAEVLRVMANQITVADAVILFATLITVSLAAPAVLYPFVFKLGAEKGRIVYYIVICAVCAMSVSFSSTTSVAGEAVTAVSSMRDGLIACAATIIVYAASWLLSIYFYQKREL